jgi:hypothetical protein
MAWSDRAREAAREARRRKAGQSIMVGTGIRSRKEMADKLRTSRKFLRDYQRRNAGTASRYSWSSHGKDFNKATRTHSSLLVSQEERQKNLRKRKDRSRTTSGGMLRPRTRRY